MKANSIDCKNKNEVGKKMDLIGSTDGFLRRFSNTLLQGTVMSLLVVVVSRLFRRGLAMRHVALAALVVTAILAAVGSAIAQQPQSEKADQRTSDGVPNFLGDLDSHQDWLGDDLPNYAVMRFGTERFQHPNSTNDMRLSSDQKTIITLCRKFMIAWDTATAKEIWRKPWSDVGDHIIGPAYGQRYLTFDDDGSRFYTTGKSTKVHVWDTRTGTHEAIDLQVSIILKAFSPQNMFTSIDVKADGSEILVGGSTGIGLYQRDGKQKWFLTNKPVLELEDRNDRLGFGGQYASAIFSPDHSAIAAVRSENEKQLIFLSPDKGEVIGTVDLPGKLVRMSFSPDGKIVYTTQRDCGIRAYDVLDRKLVWELNLKPDPKGAESYASAVACSNDGKVVAVGTPIGPNYWIRLLDAKTGQEKSILKSNMWKPWSVQFTADSKTLYSNGWDGSIRRWDVATAKELPLPLGFRASSVVTISDSGDRIAFKDGAGNLRIVDSKSGKQLRRIGPGKAPADVISFSSDAEALHLCGHKQDQIELVTYQLSDGTAQYQQQWPIGTDPHSTAEEIVSSSDGRFIAVPVFRQQKAYVFDRHTGKKITELQHKSVYGVDFSADGESVLTVGWDKTLRIWETATGKNLKTIAVLDRFLDPAAGVGDIRMYGLRVSPNGNRFVIAHMTGFSVWDATEFLDPKPLFFNGGANFSFQAIDYSNDGQWVCIGERDGDVNLHDAMTGDYMVKLGTHPKYVFTVRFGENNQLVTGGGNVGYLWNIVPEQAEQVAWETAWDRLGGDDPNLAYQAIWAIAKSKEGIDYVVRRIEKITAVLDAGNASENRQGLMIKAAARSESVELKVVVHRALKAMALSELPQAIEKFPTYREHRLKAITEIARNLSAE